MGLQGEGFITRKVYPVVPPKVEYTITDRGLRAVEIIKIIRGYGVELMKEFGVEEG
ncbi:MULTISPECIES: winged helix-turn-helix transcriptional regulator [unclassified Paraflavitalea]|uniref:winged helix-turn-helix transcriptional regulator n=1 Tax=unclassified Paraflavitalea TaxID=2798305 RepID=UPI003D33199B